MGSVLVGEGDPRLVPMPSRPTNKVMLDPQSRTIHKLSSSRQRTLDEVKWYHSLTGMDAFLAPRLISSSEGESSTYLVLAHDPTPLVSDMLVSRSAPVYWEGFFTALPAFLSVLHTPAPAAWDFPRRRDAARMVYHTSLNSRLLGLYHSVLPLTLWEPAQVNSVRTIGLQQVIDTLPRILAGSGLLTPNAFTRIHGNLHPGNMLFEQSTGRITAFSPRGSFGEPGVWGDPVLDFAKLSLAFHGGYPFILKDAFTLDAFSDEMFLSVDSDPAPSAMFEVLLEVAARFYGFTLLEVRTLEALLLLSHASDYGCLPRHQEALVAQGLLLLAKVS